MTRIGHVIVGPAQHGVVRFADDLAAAVGGPAWHLPGPADLRDFRLDGPGQHPADRHHVIDLTDPVDVHYLQYTDGLYGPDTASAATAFVALRRRLAGPAVVTLHDLPDPSDAPDRYRRRAASYRAVVAAVDAVAVSSRHEAGLLAALLELFEPAGTTAAAGTGGEATVIPLPIDGGPHPGPRPEPLPEVAVLGFVYPGKGHDAALAALDRVPAGIGLTAIGRVADGHAELAADLHATARSGRPLLITGFVPDAELTARLHRAGVPVAPSTAISASGSLNTWLAAGRRPLVAAGPYTHELAARCPGALRLYQPGELPELITQALATPSLTWLAPHCQVGPGPAAAAAAYRALLIRVANPVSPWQSGDPADSIMESPPHPGLTVTGGR